MYSKILISGRLVEPADDKPRSGVTLTLSSVKNSSVILKHATYRCVTGGNGEYSFKAAPGTYAVAVSVYGAEPERVGQIRVYSDSLPGDLNTFLMAPAEDDLTPEIIRLVDSMRSEAVKAAESAKQSEQVTSKLASDVATHAEHVASDKVVVEQKTTIATDAAATAVAAKEQTSKDAVATGKDRQVTQTKAQEATASANAAKAAQDGIVEDAADVRDKALQVAENTTLVANNAAAVQLNTEQVAKNTQTVTTKTQQVSENAQAVAANTQAVTQMRDEVVAKTSMAQAAADTATQKAASAAGHDAAAAEYARQAQEAAQATAGALMDGGAADLSAGVYPQPVVVSGTSRPTFWKVTKGGTVGGIDYGVGDTLIYTVAGSGSYYKIDNTESVTSVQGEKGAVTLTPEKIGAEPAGTASAGMQQHISAPDPHSQYAKKTEVDSKGSALAAINEHAGGVGVHSISGVIGLDQALAELNKYMPKRLFWTPTWWTNARTLRFMDMRTLWTAAGGSGNPSNDNLAPYRFDVVLSISCPAANVWDHHYAFSIHRPVANNDGVNWYVYPSSFTGHTAYNKGDICFQTVPRAENNGYGYWELRAPVDLQGVQGLNVYGEVYAYRLY
ncbi:MAG: prophage tail fiber N-terminal domain-containing protein [Shewanella sp.]